jgi:hypothetical protein
VEDEENEVLECIYGMGLGKGRHGYGYGVMC